MSKPIVTFYSNCQEDRDCPRSLERDVGTIQIEGTQRAKALREYVAESPDFELVQPTDFGLAPILAVHAPDYVAFLQESEIALKNTQSSVTADTFFSEGAMWPAPDTFYSKLGRYSLHSGTPVDSGTWSACYWSAQSALSAVSKSINCDVSTFALCRPAGHHATRSGFGGLCFINNVAVAAQWAIEQGVKKVAVLDIDVHHGNGTQELFYDSARVFTSSIHVDPTDIYPLHSGFCEETGSGNGFGWNVNRPLPKGTEFGRWKAALNEALDELVDKKPELVLVALGFDFFEDDPVSHFRIPVSSASEIGALLGRKIPNSVFFLEGGYNMKSVSSGMSLFFQSYSKGV